MTHSITFLKITICVSFPSCLSIWIVANSYQTKACFYAVSLILCYNKQEICDISVTIFIFSRRISYGNVTHLNISVTVREDNRAVLGVAVDKTDSVYFGCDAGCLDAPVPLTQSYTHFPVKLTKPLTAILYVTSDYQHMQDLRNALHVHAVNDG